MTSLFDINTSWEANDCFLFKNNDSYSFTQGYAGYNTTQEFLIKNIIPSNSFGVVFGPSGSYKSFYALGLSCCIATGMEWDGNKTDQGSVIYIAGEGGVGIKKRVKAWSDRHYEGKEIQSLAIIDQPIYPTEEENVDKLINTILEVEERTGSPVKLIILDTLARCFLGDENRTQDMTGFISGCDRIKAKTNTAIMVVHHTGKDESKGGRGSSSLRAAADFELKVSITGSSPEAIIDNTKAKDSEPYQTTAYNLSSHSLFEDEDGDHVTSLAMDIEGHKPPDSEFITQAANKGKNLTKNHKAVLQSLEERALAGVETTMEELSGHLKDKGLNTDNYKRTVSKLIKDKLVVEDNGLLSTIN